MALSPHLLQFKSSGVYRLEFDKSQVSSISAETIRLVVGHSRKGPYNTPVYIEDTETFDSVFGGIDSKLEKKGMFFHRSCIETLKRGPILALNLAQFENTDIANYASLSTNGSSEQAISVEDNDEYENFHDNDKFMFPSDAEVLATVGTNPNNCLNLVNVGKGDVSVIVRQAQDVKAFDIPCREWYGQGNCPDDLDEFSYISDYMVDVFVFKGKFNAAALDNDPLFGDHFNAEGLEKDELENFIGHRQVDLIAKYTGSLIPAFKDLEGNALYLEQMINAETRKTGVFCAVHEEEVEEYAAGSCDLVGNIYDGSESYDLLSYRLAAGEREIDLSDYTTNSVSGVEAALEYTGSGTASAPVAVGDYLPGDGNKLAKVTKVSKLGAIYTVCCSRAIATGFDSANDKGILSFESAATEYYIYNLNKAIIGAKDKAGCLAQLSNSGVTKALVDRDVIDFRYIVDTFGSWDITNGKLLNKEEFTMVAKERQNVSCILNAPTVAEFKQSTDPSFIDTASEKFETRHVATGGDLSQNPNGIYSLPSINTGSNYGFYYGPGLNVRENGKIKVIPPAAYVSNNYIDKYNNALPWSIVAGPRRGIVSGTNVVGAEYSFDKEDRDNIEPFGINPIVFERGVGLAIKGNKTGQQNVKSALSSAHVREVLIYLENGIADILKDYVFEFNTAQTRLEIKTLADSFMEGILADSGVYAYKNVMDQTNNTNEVIDNNMGILDTYVEPVKGLEIIVHRTTVLNTGEIASGGY
jgi:hypothetical protein